jgi:hypothetical protein
VSPEAAAKINDNLERRREAPLDFNRTEPLFHEIVGSCGVPESLSLLARRRSVVKTGPI